MKKFEKIVAKVINGTGEAVKVLLSYLFMVLKMVFVLMVDILYVLLAAPVIAIYGMIKTKSKFGECFAIALSKLGEANVRSFGSMVIPE